MRASPRPLAKQTSAMSAWSALVVSRGHKAVAQLMRPAPISKKGVAALLDFVEYLAVMTIPYTD